jgi:hypothetical protein
MGQGIVQRFREAISLVDLNDNGTPDIEEPWIFEFLWLGVVSFTRKQLPEESPIRIAVEVGEEVRRKVAGGARTPHEEAVPQ